MIRSVRRFRPALLAVLLTGPALSNPPDQPSPPPGPKLLVIGRACFEPALQDFLAHKAKLLSCQFRSLEGILETGKGVDDPEKVKHFLHDQWRNHDLAYALLVGDVDVFPVRYMVLDRITPAAFDYAFYPSDLYYSDLAKPDGSFDDWNARQDSFHARYFGEVRGEKNKDDPVNFDAVDYQPDIAVGRWPVSTPEEARLIAAKTIAAEQAVLANTAPHLKRAAFLATGGWVDARDRLDALARALEPGWKTERRFYADARRPNESPPDRPAVRALLDGGIGLLVHAGHGQTHGWDQCLALDDLDQLGNAGMLPVVISAGCSTACFAPLPPYEPYVDAEGHEHAGSDHHEVFSAPPPPPAPYQSGRFNPGGLGEQFLKRNPNGAVAYIGCNTGSQPCGLTLVEGFITAWSQAKEPRLGDCWAGAVRFYHEKEHLATLRPNADWYPPSIYFQGMKFMLFGDPSLRLPGR